MDSWERLAALREKMQAASVTYYLIESEDFHGSEYVGEHFRCRTWISGFTGSAGTLLVGEDEALLWTDSRYFLQAEQELSGSGIRLMKSGQEGVPSVQNYILSRVGEGCLGFDGRTVSALQGMDYRKRLAEGGGKVRPDLDLVGEIWKDRPGLSAEPAWLMDTKTAGQSRAERIARVREEMQKTGADIFLLTSLDDICWLLNIRGGDVLFTPVVLSYLMMTDQDVILYVNENIFRQEDRRRLEADGVRLAPYGQIYADAAAIPAGKTVLLDPAAVNYALYDALPEHVRIKERVNPTLLMKAVKNPVEISHFRQAHLQDGIALTKFMYWFKKNVGRIPMTEISVSEKMESLRRQQKGYLMPSFAPISAYEKHGAIVHYSADPDSDIPVEGHGLLLMDTGGQYLGGTTDITRTFVCGPLQDEEKIYFTLVLKGLLALTGARFLYGCTGVNLDYLAREPLWRIGMDFGHATGHGVGYTLSVHERPNAIRFKNLRDPHSSCVFEEGMVTSNEPGIYLTGRFGIRHENLMLCKKGEKTAAGQFMEFETLTLVPFDLDGVDPSLLSPAEKETLNQYHSRVRETIGPHLQPQERAWLDKAARRI